MPRGIPFFLSAEPLRAADIPDWSWQSRSPFIYPAAGLPAAFLFAEFPAGGYENSLKSTSENWASISFSFATESK